MSKYIDREAAAGSASESEDDAHVNDLEQFQHRQRKVSKISDSEESEAESEKPSAGDDAEDVESEGSVEPEGLSDEDLDLLEENLSRKRAVVAGKKASSLQFKRLRRRAVEDTDEETDSAGRAAAAATKSNDLHRMFDDDDDEREATKKERDGDRGSARPDETGDETSEEEESSDLDDFIEDDEEEEELPESLEGAARLKAARKPASIPRRRAIVDESTMGVAASRKVLSAALAAGQISREAWEEMMEIFGDGSEYADLVVDSDVEEDDGDYDDDEAAADKEKNERPSVHGTNANNGAKTDAIQNKMAALSIDLPERFISTVSSSTGTGTGGEDFSQEADWIAKQLAKSRPTDSFTGLSSAVGSVLRFFHVHGLEVPFIATYRKEYFSAFFGMNELWQIYDEDCQWRSLQALKRRIEAAFPEYVLTGHEDEIHLNIINEHLLAQKRQKATTVSAAAEFAFSTACMKPEELAQFIRTGSHPTRRLLNRSELDSAAFDAQASLSQSSIEGVLRAAHAAAVSQLSTDPSILAALRAMVLEQAVLTVTPTPLGAIEISHDPSHPLAPIQFVTKKPLSSFAEDDGLILCRGLDAKLITVELEYPSNPLESLLKQQQDESFNASVIKSCWTTHWQPRLHQIALQKLKSDSASWAAHFIQFYLQDELMAGPLQVSDLEDDEAAIVAVCRLPASTTTDIQLAALNRTGRLLQQERFKHGPGQVDAIVRLCRDLRPLRVVVGGEGSELLDLQDELKHRLSGQCQVSWAITNDTAQLFKASKRAAREFPESSHLLRMSVAAARRTLNPLLAFAELDAEELLSLQIHPMQAQIPSDLRLKHLQRALVNVINLLGVPVNDLDTPGQKVAMLRYVAGLGETKAAALVTGNRGLGSKPLLSRAELVTNFNLGRKVFTNCAGFIKITPPSHSRQQQQQQQRRSKSSQAQGIDEPLDGTRIHPESYDLARKMAADALELDDNDDASTIQRKQDIFGGSDDEVDTASVVKRDDKRDKEAISLIMSDPKRLDDLLLDEYAREIERLRHLPKHLTLMDIKAELQHPFPDPRDPTPATLNSSVAVLKCLTGRDENWWWPGRPLKARLFGSTGSGSSRVRLLEANDFEARVVSTSQLKGSSGRPNSTLTAYLAHYDPSRYSIEVSLQKQADSDRAAVSMIKFDPFYDFNRAREGKSRDGSARHSASTTAAATASALPTRHLSHPAFRAVSRAEAEALLDQMPTGEPLLRPSSQRRQLAPSVVAELTLSWRLAPGVHQHLPLGESDRPVGQDWLLGRSLFLPAIHCGSGSFQSSGHSLDRFEDVDEIVARRLEPILGLLQEAQACPKYFESHGSLDAVKSHLRAQAAANPARIPYCISVATGSAAGCLLLSHPSGHETIAMDPRGFLINCGGTERLFERIEGLVEFFKRNYHREFERQRRPDRPDTSNDHRPARDDPRSKYQQFAS